MDPKEDLFSVFAAFVAQYGEEVLNYMMIMKHSLNLKLDFSTTLLLQI